MRISLLLLLSTGTASADPIATSVIAKDLPSGVTFRGDFVRAVKFADKNGVNYIVFGATTPAQNLKSQTAAVYVEDWVVPATGAPRNLLPVRDFVDRCEMGGITARFHDAAFAVTDLDNNGIAEVAFAYELACRSDVSPATYKLLLLENGKKYILRGETLVDFGNHETMGGKFKPDPDASRWPSAFFNHASKLWTNTSGDLGSKD